jgi:uncharacterized membrane protein YesL
VGNQRKNGEVINLILQKGHGKMFNFSENSFWGRIMDVLEVAFRYVILNLAWLILTVPFVFLFFLILRYLFGMETYPWVLLSIPVVVASPVTGGLYFATNQLAHGIDSSLSVFWEGVKIYLWPSYRWGFLNLLIAFMLSVNIWFYGNVDWGIAPYLRVAFIVFSVFWVALQLYTFPFLIEQEKPILKMALRNSFISVARFPLQSFGWMILISVIVVVSTFVFIPLWFVISMSLITYLSNRLTLSILEKLIALEKKNTEMQKE